MDNEYDTTFILYLCIKLISSAASMYTSQPNWYREKYFHSEIISLKHTPTHQNIMNHFIELFTFFFFNIKIFAWPTTREEGGEVGTHRDKSIYVVYVESTLSNPRVRWCNSTSICRCLDVVLVLYNTSNLNEKQHSSTRLLSFYSENAWFVLDSLSRQQWGGVSVEHFLRLAADKSTPWLPQPYI